MDLDRRFDSSAVNGRASGAEAGAIHPALAHALQQLSGSTPLSAATRRAATALDVLLEDICGSPWPDAAWQFSTLTGSHFPVEFAFTLGDEVRYTAEVAGPEVDEVDRLGRAEQLVSRLGACPMPQELSERIHRMHVQTTRRLRFGAWVSGRHSSTRDRYKTYVEVPGDDSAEGQHLVRTWLGDRPRLPDDRPELRMIGFEPAASRIEFYFRAGGLGWRDIAFLLAQAKLDDRQDEFFDLVRRVHERAIGSHLPGSRFGFSFSPMPNGRSVFALFTAARVVAGSDGRIRQRVLAMADRWGWVLPGYAAVTEPLIGRTSWQTQHGLMSFIVAPDKPLAMAIGLRPPDLGA